MFGFIRKKKTSRLVIVNAENLETRVAVVENGVLEEFQVEHPTEERIVGSIFKGRIQNLEHDLQAAFVDIGLKKNAFLHYWDMVPDESLLMDIDEGPSRRRGGPKRKRMSNQEVEKRFPPKSEIVVQVTKGMIGNKGPRVTASLSIPGRYLVLVPGCSLKGVSRKISDSAERQRLKKIMPRLTAPQGTGLIVRTASIGARKTSFVRDLRGLIGTWENVQRAVREDPAPCCVYQEPGLVERVVRDWLTEDVDKIVVDSREEYDRVREIAKRVANRGRSSIQLYDGPLPVFEHHDVERQIEETYRRQVSLKSGGYIVFDETEALIAVDVNTGRHKGRGGSQEQAILEVNTEAVEEVSRQLRLRNVGGIVVVDLIDMKSKKHQGAVYRTMKAALKRDRARTNVLPISELGLLEMTRQRAEESLRSSLYVDCPYCHGHGSVKSPLAMSVDIQRQIAAVMRRWGKGERHPELQIVVHPTVLDRLRREDEEFLVDLERKHDGRLSFKSDSSKHMEFFAIVDTAANDVLYSSRER